MEYADTSFLLSLYLPDAIDRNQRQAAALVGLTVAP